jgi:hypothetical protein
MILNIVNGVMDGFPKAVIKLPAAIPACKMQIVRYHNKALVLSVDKRNSQGIAIVPFNKIICNHDSPSETAAPLGFGIISLLSIRFGGLSVV